MRAIGTALVPDIAALEGGRRQFIGRKLDPTQGEQFKDEDGIQRRQAVFIPNGDVEVPSRAEYIRTVKEGDLAPADEATAQYCGVSFIAETSAKEKSK